MSARSRLLRFYDKIEFRIFSVRNSFRLTISEGSEFFLHFLIIGVFFILFNLSDSLLEEIILCEFNHAQINTSN